MIENVFEIIGIITAVVLPIKFLCWGFGEAEKAYEAEKEEKEKK